MNKKSLFTIASVLTVCAIIVWSCEKEDKTAKKVYYNTQPGYGTGGNPNPNGVATSGGSATTSSGTTSSGTSSTGTSSTGTSTTGTSCTNAQKSNSVNGASVSANGGLGTGGTWVVNHNSTVGTVIITFATTSNPPSGTYTIVNATPGPGQCSFNDYGTNANGGTVTVTSPSTGAANGKLTYVGIVTGTYTTDGTACY